MMSKLSYALVTVVALGAAAGTAMIASTPAPEPQAPTASLDERVAADESTLRDVPCTEQPWSNADRACLTWTMPQPVDILRSPATPPSVVAQNDTPPTVQTRAVAPTALPAVQPQTQQQVIAQDEPPVVASTAAADRATVADVRPRRHASVVRAKVRHVRQIKQREAKRSPAQARRLAQQRRKAEGLRVVRRFNDDLSNIPVQAYAGDGSARTIKIKPRNTQDAIFYSQPNAGLRNTTGTSGQ